MNARAQWPDNLPRLDASLSEETVDLLLHDHGSFGLRDWLAANEAAVTMPAPLREQAR